MLTFVGRRRQFCDGVPRRNFLRVGSLIFGGLTLPRLLEAEARAGTAATGKSVINIYLSGGPTHLDTFDLKPRAAKEFRGEFSPIATKAAGLDICELLPRLASHGDKIAVIRSLTGIRDEHNPSQSDSGWSMNDLRSQGGRPGLGAVMSRVLGPASESAAGVAPTSVDLTGWTKPGFLGQVHSAYRPDGAQRNLQLGERMTEARFSDRQGLLGSLDTLRRDVDRTGAIEAMDSFSQRAAGIITSGRIAAALDLRKEPAETIDRYGAKKQRENERFILARRLIEAGVRNVSFSWGGWDTHSQNFQAMRRQLPPLDIALSALIDDLQSAGRLSDTIIMMSGEFGRTPRINGGAGRDHWPQASFFMLAGGGLKTGQAIGATSRNGERAIERPVHLQQVFATVYRQLGIDPDTILTDNNGRPQFLGDQRQVISELV